MYDERHFGMNFRIGDAITATLRFLFFPGDPSLLPHTQYGQEFLNSLYLIALAASIYFGFALFRPMLHRFHMVPRERAMAREIVQQYARAPLDLFKLWPDKSYFFSSSQRCVIAYRVSDNTAIALGDPVGPEAEIETTVREFLNKAKFATSWEPRYLVYGKILELPSAALALRRLSEVKKEKDTLRRSDRTGVR
jgi:phosphatidylglycerol lysyltransferase